jgi:hypothetical protein
MPQLTLVAQWFSWDLLGLTLRATRAGGVAGGIGVFASNAEIALAALHG